MKNTITIAMAVLLATSLFAGCQATPNEPVVIQKDIEQMIEKAANEHQGTKLSDIIDRIRNKFFQLSSIFSQTASNT